jgi:hypothetical protein
MIPPLPPPAPIGASHPWEGSVVLSLDDYTCFQPVVQMWCLLSQSNLMLHVGGLVSGFELRPKWSRVEANLGAAIDNSLLLQVGLVYLHPLESRLRAFPWGCSPCPHKQTNKHTMFHTVTF